MAERLGNTASTGATKWGNVRGMLSESGADAGSGSFDLATTTRQLIVKDSQARSPSQAVHGDLAPCTQLHIGATRARAHAQLSLCASFATDYELAGGAHAQPWPRLAGHSST